MQSTGLPKKSASCTLPGTGAPAKRLPTPRTLPGTGALGSNAVARPSRWGADAGSGGDLQRLLELDEEEARGPAAAPAEAPILCCEATGCLCVVPGQRCGMAWVKKSEYEDDRAKQVDENEAFLQCGRCFEYHRCRGGFIV